ncbi:hypothetical protein Pse7367_0399 [Thalassoporum mexicanum PCC 7367]|uniref:NAD(P)H dehydrogenase subunit NdhS n=1 Tax=Thalassoporum mexicanum TaxID=3457544 RepID=UPI00029FD46B|nr:NAD(P)H dehydrogenase subunit NdhS [Pseudanabaena sp. PCC 7367]AFY68710.1 hypothetical protein Pse7367_0399 [Pseudanabaena sp. PCC 7367]
MSEITSEIIFPGSAVKVSNQGDTYYGFEGVVQRFSDGRVAVVFSGGNWEKIVAFRPDELTVMDATESRNKGRKK